jgi:Raf kinase inhibitor-like YbhB/YbcL family protein
MRHNRVRVAALGLIVLGLLACGGASSQPVSTSQGEYAMTIQLSSPSFLNGETIPRKNTCDGEDLSPPLNWTGIPQGAKSLALIVDDPDAPRGTWVHWVIYNLPSAQTSLPEGVAKVANPAGLGAQGNNDFRRPGYGGPCPPAGTPHRYFFKLYALDASLNLGPGATKADLEKAMQGHVLAQGQLIGKYGR